MPACPIQSAIDTAISKLQVLRDSKPVTLWDGDDRNPAGLRDLATVAHEIAVAVDPILLELAYQGGISSHNRLEPYGELVSNAVESLEAELRSRADDVEEEDAEPSYSDRPVKRRVVMDLTR